MKKSKLLLVTLWCGWVIVQAPYVEKAGFKSDPARPVQEWHVATFDNRIAFFDTVKECEERAQRLINTSTCVPADWFKPHRWWQFWK